ncbi:MAG TPA: hypothetical protein VGG03_08900 [Thermoanaerobaculia bacterium]|jgi:hypothetical protein
MKRRHFIRLTLLALACVLALGTRAPAQVAGRQVVCPPGPIPQGWIKVDVVSTPATCGGNAWVLETFTNKAPGSAMVICADQLTPEGWQTLGLATSTGQCAGDTSAANNVKAIRRIG